MSFPEPRISASRETPVVRTVTVPAQWICTAKDALVIGGFQVLLGKDFLLYEPAADPNAGFVAGIWQYVAGVRGTRNQVVVKFDYEERQSVGEAILLSGRCSPNYYHWLIEYLGKARLIAGAPDLQGVPLIVDADMPAAEFESLALVLPGWPLIRVSRTTLLQVGKLHIPSVGTHLPDNLKDAGWKGGALCFGMLGFLRERVFSALGISEADPYPRRIVFLVRPWGRNITNAAQVEEVARQFGAEIVDPSVLSFADQVRLFHDSELVIGAMGASFTNLIFCRPGTRALALSSPYTQNFCVHSNLALFAGVHYSIIVGEHPQYRDGDEKTNRDVNLYLDSYSVAPEKLGCALAAWRAESTLEVRLPDSPGGRGRGALPHDRISM
ncbi:Capsular biosynthesis protein [Bordetella bronchialis]